MSLVATMELGSTPCTIPLTTPRSTSLEQTTRMGYTPGVPHMLLGATHPETSRQGTCMDMRVVLNTGRLPHRTPPTTPRSLGAAAVGTSNYTLQLTAPLLTWGRIQQVGLLLAVPPHPREDTNPPTISSTHTPPQTTLPTTLSDSSPARPES